MDDARRAALRSELESAVRKRDQLQVVIEYLSEQLGESVDQAPSASNEAEQAAGGPVAVRPGEFFGMSSTVATRTLLERVGRTQPMRTEEVLELITRGGVKLGGKDPAGTLYRSLQRDKTFFRPARGVWGLRAWYPQTAARKAADVDLTESDQEGEEATQDEEGQPVTA